MYLPFACNLLSSHCADGGQTWASGRHSASVVQLQPCTPDKACLETGCFQPSAMCFLALAWTATSATHKQEHATLTMHGCPREADLFGHQHWRSVVACPWLSSRTHPAVIGKANIVTGRSLVRSLVAGCFCSSSLPTHYCTNLGNSIHFLGIGQGLLGL